MCNLLLKSDSWEQYLMGLSVNYDIFLLSKEIKDSHLFETAYEQIRKFLWWITGSYIFF